MLTFMSACIATCEQLRIKYGHDFSETDNKQVGYYSTGYWHHFWVDKICNCACYVWTIYMTVHFSMSQAVCVDS